MHCLLKQKPIHSTVSSLFS